MPTRTILAVSGSRADWGLLQPVLQAIRLHPSLELKLAITGSHLCKPFAESKIIIKNLGFNINKEIDLELSGDLPVDITDSMGKGLSQFGHYLAKLEPDLMLVLGDRYEILVATQAALIHRVPVAHIAGGDITEGSFDDSIRHAITKMSHFHFVTNSAAFQRLIQLGETSSRVFLTGSPAIDLLFQTSLLSRKKISQTLDIQLKSRNLLICWHPATWESKDSLFGLETLLSALESFTEDTSLFFTSANADPSGSTINKRIKEFVNNHNNASFHVSLGQQKYWSLLSICDAVVGNSSSGLYEAPSLGTPTVNIGDRQHGRLAAKSVINSQVKESEIIAAIKNAYELDCHNIDNPYGDGHAVERIMNILTSPWDRWSLIRKKFTDLEYEIGK